jgi:hypothetical protein
LRLITDGLRTAGHGQKPDVGGKFLAPHSQDEMSLPDYGVALGEAEAWAAFSLSRAAFAVACCRRSESAFSRSVSGVLCGLTVVCLSDLEQPAAVNRPRTRSKSKKFFMTLDPIRAGELRDSPDC